MADIWSFEIRTENINAADAPFTVVRCCNGTVISRVRYGVEGAGWQLLRKFFGVIPDKAKRVVFDDSPFGIVLQALWNSEVDHWDGEQF